MKTTTKLITLITTTITLLFSANLNAKEQTNWYDGIYIGAQAGNKTNVAHVNQTLNINSSKGMFELYAGYQILKYLDIDIAFMKDADNTKTLAHEPQAVSGQNLVEEKIKIGNYGFAINLKPNFKFYEHGMFKHKLFALVGLEYKNYNSSYKTYSQDYDSLSRIYSNKYLSSKVSNNENLFYYSLGLGYELLMQDKIGVTFNYNYSIANDKSINNFTFKNENRFLFGIKAYL